MDLIVSKKNEAFALIECEPGVQRELSEFFTFYAPGYKFMPAYKNKLWDGKIRLFDMQKKTLPIGLIQYLPEFAQAREYAIHYEPNSYYGLPNILNNVDMDYFKQFQITVGGKRVEPYDYQNNAVQHALTHQRGILLSPTASGKSLIIYMMMRWFIENDANDVLIVVPTTSLVEQMYSDFCEYSSIDDGFDPQVMHKIYSGKDKFDAKNRIVITTWQSIHKLNTPWFERFGMVIGDEAHTFKAKSLTSIMSKCTEASYRLGTTGTLDGTQVHKLVLEGLFGQVHQVITTKELMDDDKISQLNINVLVLKYYEEYRKAMRTKTYREEVDFIVQCESRNNFIRNLAIDLDGNTLILYNYVEKHGKPLYELIKKKLDENPRIQRKLFFISGATDVDQRENVRSITEKEKDAIIVASLGTFSTGVNIRNLHNIIFASPSKSQIKVLQSIGRGLRKSDDGRETSLYDIADDLQWKRNKNYTLDHAAARIAMYTKERFNYKIYEVELPR